MTEITYLIDKSGAKGNKGDMAQVKLYLEERGLGEIFGIVVGGGDF